VIDYSVGLDYGEVVMKKLLDQQSFYRVLSGAFIFILSITIWGVSSPVESANAANLDVHLQPTGKDAFNS
jgi:hypothetical protein